MDLTTEVAMYDSMHKTLDELEILQGRMYGFTCIPLEKRDELSKKLYEVRDELLDWELKLGGSLVVMGAFD